MKTRLIIFGSLLLLFSCQQQQTSSAYPRWIGDIAFDPKTDRADFHLCHEDHIAQYFNYAEGPNYEGEKYAILEAFRQDYQAVEDDSQTGSLRIRFVVNCRGETDRFRIMGMDKDYQPKDFRPEITDQLLDITRKLNGWKVISRHEVALDYYQYLIFKLDKGQLTQILP